MVTGALVNTCLLGALALLCIDTAHADVNPCTTTGMSPIDYQQALCMSLFFYEAQRSGYLPANKHVSWRNDSGLDDGSDVGYDLVGGYYDAGNYVKFGFPMAFTVTMLSWGLLEFPDGYSEMDKTRIALDTIKWATDYFFKCHTSSYELWGQVGNGNVDNSSWGRPETMTMERPAYKIDESNPARGSVDPGWSAWGPGDPGWSARGSGDPGWSARGSGDPGWLARGSGDPGWSARGSGDPGWLARGSGDPGWSARGSGEPGWSAGGSGNSSWSTRGSGDPGWSVRGPGDSSWSARGSGDPGWSARGPGDPGWSARDPGDPGWSARDPGDPGWSRIVFLWLKVRVLPLLLPSLLPSLFSCLLPSLPHVCFPRYLISTSLATSCLLPSLPHVYFPRYLMSTSLATSCLLPSLPHVYFPSYLMSASLATSCLLPSLLRYFSRQKTDSIYATWMMDLAKVLYDFADNFRGHYDMSIPDAKDWYPSTSGYGDELVWAGLWLYRATEDASYLTRARGHWDEFSLQSSEAQLFYWDDKMAGVYALFWLLDGSQDYLDHLTTYLDYLKNTALYTPEGLVFLDESGTTRHAANAAFISLLAAKYGVDTSLNNQWGQAQMDQLLGANSRYNMSFVVGFGDNYPQRPHHRSSSCPDPPEDCDYGWAYTQSGPNPHTLYGALVSGPSLLGEYEDDRTNRKYNDVACDFNAAFSGCLAALIELS
nr:endoglucanase A-like [Cherax quadricarinatus]